MKNIKVLNEYLASQFVMVAKLHNLHWNVEGANFKEVHLATEGLYEEFFDGYDEVAERIKMLGEFPLVQVNDFVKTSFISELPSKTFTIKEVLTIVIKDLQLFKEKAITIRNIADKEEDFVTVAIFEGYVAKLDKHLWFLQATNK